MSIAHDSKWFGVNDARIRKVTADPAGGTPTYGTPVDVPGIKTVAITGDVNTNELRGDGQRLDQDSNLAGLSISFEFAKSSLDLFALVAGGTVTDSGAAGAEVAEWKLAGGDKMNYFEFEAQTTGVSEIGGDGHIILHKVILSSFPELGNAEEDYKTYTVEGAAMTLQSTGDLLTVRLNKVAVAIPA